MFQIEDNASVTYICPLISPGPTSSQRADNHIPILGAVIQHPEHSSSQIQLHIISTSSLSAICQLDLPCPSSSTSSAIWKLAQLQHPIYSNALLVWDSYPSDATDRADFVHLGIISLETDASLATFHGWHSICPPGRKIKNKNSKLPRRNKKSSSSTEDLVNVRLLDVMTLPTPPLSERSLLHPNVLLTWSNGGYHLISATTNCLVTRVYFVQQSASFWVLPLSSMLVAEASWNDENGTCAWNMMMASRRIETFHSDSYHSR